jgi:hypothetical protein
MTLGAGDMAGVDIAGDDIGAACQCGGGVLTKY